MPWPKNRIPAYCHHKPTDQAYVRLGGKLFYLGRYNSAASRREYDRLTSEWLAAGRKIKTDPESVTVGEIVLGFVKHAQVYYRKPDGTPTSEATRVVSELRPLIKLYKDQPAAAFGPLSLEAVRNEMIQLGWVRSTINHAIGTVKRCFKWGTQKELIPPSVLHGLQSVDGLEAGRSEAKESKPVRPVPDEFVDAVLPFVNRHVGAMIELQRLSGMRSGEVCIMRGADIDTTGELWCYTPSSHKTQHHQRHRQIWLGARCQAILRPFLKPDVTAYLFSPREAEAERRGAGNPAKRVAKRSRPLGDRYKPLAYARAVTYGCDAADKWAHGGLAIPDDERVIPRWNPHRLRHTFATRVRKAHGVEGAQVLLGHSQVQVTQLYAEVDATKAQRIMRLIG